MTAATTARRPDLTMGEVAERLAISIPTLYRWMKEGAGPPCYRFNTRSVRFDAAELDAWMLEHRYDGRRA